MENSPEKRLDQKRNTYKLLPRAESDTETTPSVSAAAPPPHLGFIRGAEAARERLVGDFHDVIRPIGTRESARECGGALDARARLVTRPNAADFLIEYIKYVYI